MLSSKLFKGNDLIFLVDSGSDLSFVKKSKLSNSAKFDTSNKIKVNGLSNNSITTLGAITLKIAKTECNFHVLDDEEINLIKYDGILGKDFTQKTDCDILLSKNCLRVGKVYVPFIQDPFITLQARTKQLLTINIRNFEKKEGLVIKQNVGQGVFI